MFNGRNTLISSAVAALAVIGLTSACSSSSMSTSRSEASTSTTTTTKATSAPRANTITIANFAFGKPITVQPGATVTVKNAGSETHTLTADDATFDTGNIFGGKTTTFTAPTKPGTYAFHCNIHDMHGTLVVAA